AIYFIGQQQLSEDWPLAKMELLTGTIEYRHANDVGGQQIARELYALPRKPQHMRKRMRQRGLADTGHVFDEQVAAGEQAGETEPNLSRLAQNERLESADCAMQRRGINVNRGCRVHGSNNRRTRFSCSVRLVTVRSSSATRARSVSTTSGGAL